MQKNNKPKRNSQFDQIDEKYRSSSEVVFSQSLIQPQISKKQNLNLKISLNDFPKVGIVIYEKADYKKQNYCLVCLRKFTQIFRQHHCRTCANAVCADCSLAKLNTQRICDLCYLKYSNLQQQKRRKKALQTYRTLCGYLIYKKNTKMQELQQLKSKSTFEKEVNEQKEKQSQDIIIRTLKSESSNLQQTKKYLLIELSNMIQLNKKVEEKIHQLDKQFS